MTIVSSPTSFVGLDRKLTHGSRMGIIVLEGHVNSQIKYIHNREIERHTQITLGSESKIVDRLLRPDLIIRIKVVLLLFWKCREVSAVADQG